MTINLKVSFLLTCYVFTSISTVGIRAERYGNAMKRFESTLARRTPDSVLFNKDEPFKILTFKRGITTQASQPDTTPCKNWQISQDDIPRIIRHSKSISGTELDLSFLVLSCITTGEILQNDRHFTYEINAGSWMYINCKDTTIILGNFRKADKRFFLSPPDID